MRAVDTNVVVRLIARDDPTQTEKAEEFISNGAWVSNLVLAESVWVLESVYELGKTQLRTAIAMLLEHQQLILQDTDAVRGALEEFAANRGVGFTDCLVVAIAKKHGYTPVGTFDKKLSKLTDAQAI